MHFLWEYCANFSKFSQRRLSTSPVAAHKNLKFHVEIAQTFQKTFLQFLKEAGGSLTGLRMLPGRSKRGRCQKICDLK